MNTTITELKERLERLRADIADECDYWHSNCQACKYERRCSTEIDHIVRQIKDAYCEEAAHDCSRCEYLRECTAPEASDEREKQKYKKHLDTCKALGSNCSKCEYFKTHCSFKKGHYMWLKKMEECCKTRYGCIHCPAYILCSRSKCQHVKRLRHLIAERKLCEFDGLEVDE